MSSSDRAFRVNTRVLERSAEITSNEGFSVVAPISVTVPFSTCGRNASCCALLNRWISSTKRIVRRPSRRVRSAATMISLISLIPASTALNGTKFDFVMRAMIRASVVFPRPEAPTVSSREPGRALWPSAAAFPAQADAPVQALHPGCRPHTIGEWRVRGRLGWPVGVVLEKRPAHCLSFLDGRALSGSHSHPLISAMLRPMSRLRTAALARLVVLPLFGGLVQNNSGGHRRIQGFDARTAGNSQHGVAHAHFVSGESASFITNNDYGRRGPVPRIDRFNSGRRGSYYLNTGGL